MIYLRDRVVSQNILSLTLEPKAQLILEEVLPKFALINNFKLKNLHFFFQLWPNELCPLWYRSILLVTSYEYWRCIVRYDTITKYCVQVAENKAWYILLIEFTASESNHYNSVVLMMSTGSPAEDQYKN